PQSSIPDPAYWPTDSWESSTPEQQGMDSNRLADLFGDAGRKGTNLHSLLVIRNGYLVLEAYYNPYTNRNRHSLESITKSVIGALVGIAIDKKTIQNDRQKVLSFFPDLTIANLDNRKKSLTLAHLLSLTSGFDCRDDAPAIYSNQGENRTQVTLNLPMISDPGQSWFYCSRAVDLLSAIVQKRVKMDTRTFANNYLFDPLGIAITPESSWDVDPQGVTLGGYGLSLTPSDIAKLGFLYLHNGKWEGKQVLPAAWVASSTSEHASIGKDAYVGGRDRSYGYLWSLFPEKGYYAAIGMGGQILVVHPTKNLVVVMNAAVEAGKESQLLDLYETFILPSIQSQTEIPENQPAYERLQQQIQRAANAKTTVEALNEVARQVSGKSYQLKDSATGWKSIRFDFSEGASTAMVTLDGEAKLEIGLDEQYRLTTLVQGVNPYGLRGRWGGNNTFIVDTLVLGTILEQEMRIQFLQNQIQITIRDRVMGGEPLVLNGSLLN
ncbi:MAG: serine hydrolase domain-containing protein, partial [Omnitrophica WOR_2 bacterium]